MKVNPSQFHKLNVIDTCAVWNVLSSRLLYQTSISVGCSFSFTAFVHYECLLKKRTRSSAEDAELKKRLAYEQGKGRFLVYHLSIEDLQDVDVLERRKNLGKGELSSIAFAKRTLQAFMTDDFGARKLATQVISSGLVQTTPHLFGWLYFSQILSDSDKEEIIKEHESLRGPLRPHFETMYSRALHYRLLANKRVL
jgi:hypothetical protein